MEHLSGDRDAGGESNGTTYRDDELIYPTTKLLDACDVSFVIASRECGTMLLARGDYDESVKLFERLAPAQARKHGTEDADYLRTQYELACAYVKQGRSEKAEPILRNLLETRSRVLGEGHPHTLNALHTLADIFRQQGKTDEAEKIFLKLLTSFEKQSGIAHFKYYLTLNALANIYGTRGQLELARDTYLRSLKGLQDAPEQFRLDIYMVQQNLAQNYAELGEEILAEEMYERAMSTMVSALGEAHPQTNRVMKALARFYEGTDQYAKAKVLYEKLACIKEAEGKTEAARSEALDSQLDVARICAKLKEFKQAARMAESIVQQRQVIFEEPPPRGGSEESRYMLLSAQQLLATFYQDQDMLSKSEPLLLDVLAGYRDLEGAESPSALECRYWLCDVWRKKGQMREAESSLRDISAESERILGPDDSITIRSMLSHVSTLCQLGRVADAQPIAQSALSRSEKAHGRSSLITLRLVAYLALTYLLQRAYVEAKPLEERAWAGRRQKLGDEHYDTLLSAQGLALSADMLGDTEQALEMYEKCVHGFEKLNGHESEEFLEALEKLIMILRREKRTNEVNALVKEYAAKGLEISVIEDEE